MSEPKRERIRHNGGIKKDLSPRQIKSFKLMYGNYPIDAICERFGLASNDVFIIAKSLGLKGSRTK